MLENNRMFAEMLKPAREWLAGRNPEEIARNAAVGFDGVAFEIPCLNRVLRLSWPGLEFSGPVDGWLQLLALHYLSIADGAPLREDVIPFAMLKDGMIRGGGFDRQCEQQLAQFLAGIAPDELESRCRMLNGEICASNADFCARFFFLPRYPLLLKVWFADEDFPASGRLFLNGSADHYLTVEDAVTVGDIFLRTLMESGVEE